MRAALAFLLSILVCLASANVEKSEDTIVGSTVHASLKSLATELGFPDTVLPNGTTVTVIEFYGPHLKVTVVGPIEGKAEAYAAALDKWREQAGLPGTVYWSQENDSASAQYDTNPFSIGTQTGQTQVAMRSLAETVSKLEKTSHIAAIDLYWSNVPLGLEPDAKTKRGSKLYNLSDLAKVPEKVVASYTMPGWLLPALIAWFAIPIVGFLVSATLAIWVAKNEKFEVEKRRKLYQKFVMGGTTLCLGVHGVLVVATLPTRALEPLAQLWFGMRFTQLAIPIVPLFAIVPIASLSFLNKTEKKLFAPTEEEEKAIASDPVPTRSTRKEIRKRETSPVIKVIFSVLLVFLGGALIVTGINRGFAQAVPFAIILPILASSLFGGKDNVEVYEVSKEEEALLTAKVQSMANELSMKLGITAPITKILTEVFHGKFGGQVTQKELGISVHAAEHLPSDELEALIAHELAHVKLNHLKEKRLLILVPAAVVFALLIVSFPLRSVIGSSLIVPFAGILLLGFTYTPWLKKRMHKHEFDADKVTAVLTGKPLSLATFLERSALHSGQPGIHQVMSESHPVMKLRIDALRAMA